MPVPCVYILASRRNGTLYVGVSSDLTRRVWEHKQDLVAGFTKRYQVHTLVWFEVHGSMGPWRKRSSGRRPSRSGDGPGSRLIEADNPEWRDLYEDLIR